MNDVATAARHVAIVNKRGLHARAAAKFVKLAAAFRAQVTVSKGEVAVPGSSIMGLMMLAAGPGCVIEIAASGEDARACVDALTLLVEQRFDED